MDRRIDPTARDRYPWETPLTLAVRVRRAARATSRLRLFLVLAAVALVWGTLTTGILPMDIARWLAVVYIAAILLGLPLVALFRFVRRRQLRAPVAAVATEEARKELLALRASSDGDTRRLAAALLRDLRSEPAEVAPSRAAAGRGDEGVPSD